MLGADVAALPVDLFRVLVGLLALGYCARQLGEVDLYWGPDSLVPHAVSRSVFAFTWQPLFPLGASTGWVTAAFGSGCVLAAAVVLGIFPRLCALGLYALVVCAYRYDFLVLFVDDVVVHLLLFWVVLLPVGSTLSVTELVRDRKGSWANWQKARVSGTTVRLFLANLAFLYLVAGLSKWGSPLWRSGDALYAVLQLPMSRLSELVNDSHVPFLRCLDYATLVVEPLLGVGILVSSNRAARVGLVASLLLFHLGIAVAVYVPFANLGCLTVIPLLWRNSTGARAPNDHRAFARIEPAVGFVVLVLLVGAMFGSLTGPAWRSPGLGEARGKPSFVEGASAETGGPMQTAFFGALWCLGLAQQYRLLDWIDDRNFHVATRFRVTPTDGSSPTLVPGGAILPQDMRTSLLLSYLGGVTWMPIPPRGVLPVRRDIEHRIARRACNVLQTNADVELEAEYSRVDPRQASHSERATLAAFRCSTIASEMP
jgi:hypothetical protein